VLVSDAMVSASPILSGTLLIGAGTFQFTPLKDRCVTHCRSPLSFLTGHWREGTAGAFGMGAHHGTYCVGCCWALMALLFVLGVMNLLWVAGLAVLVLAEKTLPAGRCQPSRRRSPGRIRRGSK
jgi:predicted metal-binding membrane protein